MTTKPPAVPQDVILTGTSGGTAAADTTAPTVTQGPPNGADAGQDLVIVFSEPIRVGNGTVILRGPDNFTYTVSLPGPETTVSGNKLVFNPPAQLGSESNYLMDLRGAGITDIAGNAVQGSLVFIFTTGRSSTPVHATGSDHDDTLYGSDVADDLSGGAGADHLYGYGGDDVLAGGDEPDQAGARGDNLDGGDGNDILTANAGNDLLYGGAGNDKLYGDSGADQLEGGPGDDLLDGGTGNDYLNDLTGSNTLLGGDGDDNLSVSSDGTNTLDGGAGNDTLSGGRGTDTLSGGAGNDTISLLDDFSRTAHTVVIAGGDGNDLISFGGNSSLRTVQVTGGTGADTFKAIGGLTGSYTIDDFSATAGDKLDLTALLPYELQGNPFRPGSYLKAEQVGSDTVISYDFDASAPTSFTYRPIFVLKNVQFADLTASSFVGGMDPHGGSTGLRLDGTTANDELKGGPLDDTINGGDGADTIFGGGGNDTLVGGSESAADGADHLYGEVGDDTLSGGAGADELDGGWGDDRLDGGSGNDVLKGYTEDDILNGGPGDDTLYGGEGNDQLDGGDGNDTLQDGDGINVLVGGLGNDLLDTSSYSVVLGSGSLDGGPGDDRLVGGWGNDSLAGGDGNDTIEIGAGYVVTKVSASGGAGDDQILVKSTVAAQSISASGGGGTDTYHFNTSASMPSLAILDFATGAQGDVLDVQSLFEYGSGALSGNPFKTQYLRLQQSGGDTLLQVDRDGPGGSGAFQTVAVLKGVNAADLTAANFTLGLAPDGTTQGSTLQGTTGADTLRGGPLDDVINGLGGDDYLAGDGGNDRLDGGEGRDTLDGGAGDDTLLGGAGNDDLTGGTSGNDQLDGGDGNDTLREWDGNNILLGGPGDDRIELIGHGDNRVDGGDGNDDINTAGGNDTVFGGAGNDRITVDNMFNSDGASRVTRLDGGDGNDVFSFSLSAAGKVTIIATGGAGADDFQFRAAPANGSTVTINGFQPGEGGDLVSMLSILSLGNPFGADGSLRLVQRGADAVVQYDSDGAKGPEGFMDLLTISGIDKSALTAANFYGGFSPDGTSKGRTITGTDGSDHITGGYADDQITGAGGDDVLDGSMGNDHIDGGAGDDRLDGGAGDDVLGGGPGNDYIDAGKGNDTADGGDGNDHVISTEEAGNKTFSGGAGDDYLAANAAGTSVLAGGAGDDTLMIVAGDGTLDGGDGNDTLSIGYPVSNGSGPPGRVTMLGGAGDDVFKVMTGSDMISATGGAGRDTFQVDSWGRAYTVTDFEAGAGGDRIHLDYTYNHQDVRNPFGEAGYLRVVQDGADTVLEWDGDGAAGKAYGYVPMLRLKNVDATKLVADNFVELFDPHPGSGQHLVGTDGNNVLEGGAGDDVLDGGNGNDVLVGGPGNDTLNGGAGLDVARYSGEASRYTVIAIAQGFRIADNKGTDGTDVLAGVERAMFADQGLAFDIDGVAGQAYRIYRAAFDRAPDLAGMGYWLKQMDAGATLASVAAGFVESAEFQHLYGTQPSNAQVVDRLYQNILHRPPEQAGFDYWVSILNDKKAGLADVLAAFSEGAENMSAVAGLIAQGIPFAPFGG